MTVAPLRSESVPRLDQVLEWIAASASGRDRVPFPPFPEEAILRLQEAGALAFNAEAAHRPPAAEELRPRSGGCSRRWLRRQDLRDGHLNAVERLAVQASKELRDVEVLRGCPD